MKPQTSSANNPSAFQLFQSRLDQQLNPDHPLVLLADLIQWQRFDEAFAPLYCPDNGAPALPTRLMVGNTSAEKNTFKQYYHFTTHH
jgi:hypothetical protein